MKTVFLVLLAFAIAAANGSSVVRLEPTGYSSQSYTRIPIVRFTQDIQPGSDAVAFETGNGIVLDDSTQVVSGRGGSYDDGYGKIIQTDSSLVKTGSYSYTSPEGRPVVVKWVADERGFRAESDSIPTTPAPLPLPVREMSSY